MKPKNGKTFDISSLKPETGVVISPRSEDTTAIFEKLNELQVGESYKMPRTIQRSFINAKVTLHRTTGKVIIYRNLDKYNFRCWRKPDGTILTTRKKKK